MSTLGIIAGGGELPRAIAISAQGEGRGVFILALSGMAGDWVRDFPHAWLSMGQIGKTIRLLRANNCTDMMFAGYVSRPNFFKLRYDAKGVSWLLAVLWAMRKGDNTLLDAMVGLFEREGFSVKGVADVAPSLQIPPGPLGNVQPTPQDESDIAIAIAAARKQGARDVGQAVIVRNGEVVGVERKDGTDAMLRRLPPLESGAARRGVLAKALKPQQDRKTDLPTIGVATVQKAAAAGLAGIAVEADTALVLDKAAVATAADALGIFVTAVAP
jgi:DUF1009 family protein